MKYSIDSLICQHLFACPGVVIFNKSGDWILCIFVAFSSWLFAWWCGIIFRQFRGSGGAPGQNKKTCIKTGFLLFILLCYLTRWWRGRRFGEISKRQSHLHYLRAFSGHAPNTRTSEWQGAHTADKSENTSFFFLLPFFFFAGPFRPFGGISLRAHRVPLLLSDTNIAH